MVSDAFDVLVVGCGISGSVVARHFAEKDKRVQIFDRRNHIGGNMYDYLDDNGIRVHKYGPHVFHTNDDNIKDYVERFGDWTEFKVRCRAEILGKITPSPFNFQTIDDFYSKEEADNLKNKLLTYYRKEEATIVEMLDSDDVDIKAYADFLYQNDYSLYTAKQWGISPEDIDKSVLKRVPVYFSYKDGCFEDDYQIVPVEGYTEWFRKLLDHKNISISLGHDVFKKLTIAENTTFIDGREFKGLVVYTGAIDELFDCRYGNLPYRSLVFKWGYADNRYHQQAPLVVNPSAKEYTRITEYSYFPHRHISSKKTSFSYECPTQYKRNSGMEPYYPMQTRESAKLLMQYEQMASQIPNLVCVGRLARFKYYNMDQALNAALETCEELDKKAW